MTGANSVGALIGFVDSHTAKIENCSTKNVQLTNTATGETAQRVGYIAGRTNMTDGKTLTVTGFTHENVTVNGTALDNAFGVNEAGTPTIS